MDTGEHKSQVQYNTSKKLQSEGNQDCQGQKPPLLAPLTAAAHKQPHQQPRQGRHQYQTRQPAQFV